MIGAWTKLADGSWGVEVRCGGRGAAMVGKCVVVRRKDRGTSNVMLRSLVQDFGAGDVAIFAAESLS